MCGFVQINRKKIEYELTFRVRKSLLKHMYITFHSHVYNIILEVHYLLCIR